MKEASQIIEDIKYILFNDRTFDPELKFVTWVSDSESFIVSKDGKEYRISVKEEEYI